ncbi:YbaK/EbsC family protein [Dactylosporangium sp. CA-233914]|uniref:YbaK/EbsC family protein n=1 Tax=Dactylosporangium sp. CA-233914 TaxID=3239934 RepID=UPI003D92B48D
MSMMAAAPPGDVYGHLRDLFRTAGVWHRYIDHPPEGRTGPATELRGHRLSQAAKCLVVEVAIGRRRAVHALAVVGGHRQVDLSRVRDALGGRKAFVAARDTAERLTGCVSGAIVPFALCAGLRLLLDHDLLGEPVLYFNAARLDRSVALSLRDYVSLAAPQVERIAAVPA